MIENPEPESERWDEPVIADSPTNARRECQKRATCYRADLESVTQPSKFQTSKKQIYRCHYGLLPPLQAKDPITAPPLNLTHPGAAVGQIILAVDLTIAGDPTAVMQAIWKLGYEPGIRYVAYSEGIHILAVLIDEQHSEIPDDQYLLEKWLQVRQMIDPEAVHLWRGHPNAKPLRQVAFEVA